MKSFARWAPVNRFTLQSRRTLSTSSPSVLNVSEEVQQAIFEKRPVVALESAIYTHGFPYPDNISLAHKLESLVRSHGGVPATVGIVKGIPTVGFSSERLSEYLERSNRSPAIKISRRDIAIACAKKLDGGTTIAGTSVLAHLAGIEVFATGGLGGVHRGDNLMDISADLHELGQTPITVISSGCKSFLDIPKTLEYLETMGVIVATFSDGRGEHPKHVSFPAFWTRETRIPSPAVLLNEVEAAQVIRLQRGLGLKSGMLFANPIAEDHSLDESYMEEIMKTAIEDASAAGATGHANTPFVLRRIRELTGNKTIMANQELVTGNIIRGTRVAVELSSLSHSSATTAHHKESDRLQQKVSSGIGTTQNTAKVMVLGSVAIDDHCDCELSYSSDNVDPILYTSNLGSVSSCIGGVGYNLALSLSYAGIETRFSTLVGDDARGDFIIDTLKRVGISPENVTREQLPARTARYVAINKADASLFVAVADMKIFENVSDEFLNRVSATLFSDKPKIVLVDGNFDSRIVPILRRAQSIQARIIFEPVSVPKSTRIFEHSRYLDHKVDVITPNNHELEAMFVYQKSMRESQMRVIDNSWHPYLPDSIANAVSQELVSREEVDQAIALSAYFHQVIVKLGSRGILVVDNTPKSKDDGFESVTAWQSSSASSRENHALRLRHIAPPRTLEDAQIVSVNGAGDTFVGVYAAGLCQSLDPIRAVEIAAQAALMTLQSRESVSENVKDLRLSLSI